MPFKSEKQRRYMHANLPEIAQRWERDYASGGIARVGYQQGMGVAPFPPPNDLGNPLNDSRIVSEEQGLSGYPNMLGDKGGSMNFMSGSLDAPYGVNSITGMPYQQPRTIADQNRVLGQTFTQRQPAWYNKMFNKAGQGITGLKNQMGNIFTGAKDAVSGIFSGAKNKGGALVGNIMGMAMGIPGLGALLGNIRPDNPYEKFQKQMFSDMYGGHDFGNKDPFGKNIRSLFGEYDVKEQFDKLAGSKIGQKYGYKEAMADGEISDKELAEMQAKGLKGYQLNRFRALAAAKKKAQAYHKKIADAQALKEKQKEERKKQAQARHTAPRHHQDVSRNRGDHTAPTFRDIKDEGPGVTASSGMHGGKHYAIGGRVYLNLGGLARLL